MVYSLPLFGLIFPFFAWAIETILPYPHIVEELGKVFFTVLIWHLPQKSLQIKLMVSMAIFFTFSESVFYLFNLSFNGNLPLFFLRLILTALLHILTSLIILMSTFINKKLIVLGFILAITIHYFFNFFVSLIY